MEDKNYKTALSVFLKLSKSGTKYNEYSLDVGITPPVLQNLNAPALPMTISVKAIDKCFFEHGVTESMLGRLYDLIANPTTVYKSDSPHIDPTKVHAVVVVTIEAKAGNPLLVAVHMNQMIGRRQVNQIKSVYDKPAEVVQKWRRNGLVMWDKPTAPAALATVTAIKPAAPEVAPAAPITSAAPVTAPTVTVKKTRQISKN